MSKDPFNRAVRVTLTHAIFQLDAARVELERTPLTATPDDIRRAYTLLHEARDVVRIITAAVDIRATAQPSLLPEDR